MIIKLLKIQESKADLETSTNHLNGCHIILLSQFDPVVHRASWLVGFTCSLPSFELPH